MGPRSSRTRDGQDWGPFFVWHGNMPRADSVRLALSSDDSQFYLHLKDASAGRGSCAINKSRARFLRRKAAIVVPHAGIEPALLSELDFESSASTSSANGARDLRQQSSPFTRWLSGRSTGKSPAVAPSQNRAEIYNGRGPDKKRLNRPHASRRTDEASVGILNLRTVAFSNRLGSQAMRQNRDP